MTPDAAGRPERSDLTVDQHRMVAPSRVWLMPPPGDPTWYAGTWKSNPLTVVVGDVPYVPESEVTRLRAEVEALREEWKQGLPVLERLYRAVLALPTPLGREVAEALGDYHAAIGRLHALLAAHKGEG